jgi:hypothetical protein
LNLQIKKFGCTYYEKVGVLKIEKNAIEFFFWQFANLI